MFIGQRNAGPGRASPPSPGTLGSMPSGFELFAILGVVVLLFGSTKLPKMARSMGQAQREFKQGQTEEADEKRDEQQSSS